MRRNGSEGNGYISAARLSVISNTMSDIEILRQHPRFKSYLLRSRPERSGYAALTSLARRCVNSSSVIDPECLSRSSFSISSAMLNPITFRSRAPLCGVRGVSERSRDFSTVAPPSVGSSMSVSGCVSLVSPSRTSPSCSFPRPANTGCHSKRDHQLQEVKHQALKFA